ncbi:MAG: hypothetical protein AAGI37_16290 [Planctomycetota bacterium]
MNEQQPDQTHASPDRDALDEATATRLAKLGQRAPDVCRFEQRLAEALKAQAEEVPNELDKAQPYRIAHWLRPVAGIAAAIAIVLTLFVVTGTNPPTASASVVELSQLHADMVSGRVALTPAGSVAEVNASIASQLINGTALPSDLAGTRVQSCCLTDVQGDLVALAMLRDGDTLATLVVAEAPNFAHQMGIVIEIDGKTYFGHELNGINMMMANQEDRWLCVMGHTTFEDLAQIAADVRFGNE